MGSGGNSFDGPIVLPAESHADGVCAEMEMGADRLAGLPVGSTEEVRPTPSDGG